MGESTTGVESETFFETPSSLYFLVRGRRDYCWKHEDELLYLCQHEDEFLYCWKYGFLNGGKWSVKVSLPLGVLR